MSGKYDAARDAFGSAALSWTESRIVARLVSTAFLFNHAARDPAGLAGLLGEPVELEHKTLAAGWAGASTILFKQVAGAAKAGGIVLYSPADEGRGPVLIVHLNEIDKFPMQLNGGDIEIDVPDPGLFRI